MLRKRVQTQVCVCVYAKSNGNARARRALVYHKKSVTRKPVYYERHVVYSRRR